MDNTFYWYTFLPEWIYPERLGMDTVSTADVRLERVTLSREVRFEQRANAKPFIPGSGVQFVRLSVLLTSIECLTTSITL